MFLVCDKIMHLGRLPFSWLYNQENDTLPIDFLKVSISWYTGKLGPVTSSDYYNVRAHSQWA